MMNCRQMLWDIDCVCSLLLWLPAKKFTTVTVWLMTNISVHDCLQEEANTQFSRLPERTKKCKDLRNVKAVFHESWRSLFSQKRLEMRYCTSKKVQHVNRMPCNRLPRVMKRYSPTGRRNHGRPLKRLLDTWDWNRSTSGPTPWQIYDDDAIFKISELMLMMRHLVLWNNGLYQLPKFYIRNTIFCKLVLNLIVNIHQYYWNKMISRLMLKLPCNISECVQTHMKIRCEITIT